MRYEIGFSGQFEGSVIRWGRRRAIKTALTIRSEGRGSSVVVAKRRRGGWDAPILEATPTA